MPKDQESTAGIGDNLTIEQEARALRIVHVSKLRQQDAKVAKAKEAYDAERAVMTDLFHLAKAETRYSRKELRGLLDALQLGSRGIAEDERRRAILWADWDLPIGTQLDLFDRMPIEAQDEAYAKGMGYAAGLRGDARELPEGMHVRFSGPFCDGWNKGQEELIWAMAAAGRISDRKAGARTDPVPLSAEPGEDGEDKEAPAAKPKGRTKARATKEPAARKLDS